MRYATGADAGPDVPATKMGRGSFEPHAGNYLAEGDSAKASIRIHTLGRFTVVIDGRAICSHGKAQKRPLALLKALIALGGRDVASSQLWEWLWPDSEGDLGIRNLTVTLHRLRRLLESPSSVLQHDGKLTLNERTCWVDTWQFERAAGEGLRLLDSPAAGKTAETRLRQALNLYAGHFLARESEEAWMLAPRLRLKLKFERLVSVLSGYLEDRDRHGDAANVCLHALERDPLNELLYRRLMRCYLKNGEVSKVLHAYRCCLEALRNGFAVRPSQETERVYLEALGAAKTGTENDAAKPCGIARIPMGPGTVTG